MCIFFHNEVFYCRAVTLYSIQKNTEEYVVVFIDTQLEFCAKIATNLFYGSEYFCSSFCGKTSTSSLSCCYLSVGCFSQFLEDLDCGNIRVGELPSMQQRSGGGSRVEVGH